MARIIKPRRKDFILPDDYKPYIDKYFLRSKTILKRDGLNPRVKYQIFFQKGPGIVCGIDEAIAIIRKYAEHPEEIEIKALYDGEPYRPKETIMTIEGPVQELIDLETLYLGVLSTGTTIASNMHEICSVAKDKDVFYFGARHWRFDSDREISYAAWVGGARGVSTDIGASSFGEKGMGTIPHALVLIYEDTVKTAQRFAHYFAKEAKVVALVDTYNKEITDSLRAARALGEKLYAVRIDTAGENIGEGCRKGFGVTVELARKVRAALDREGFEHVRIFLSSGFNAKKVREFVEAEQKYGKFFDAIGTGSIFENIRFATADIVEKDGRPCHKVGRPPRPNPRLKEVDL
ncbi:MAG: nicotinate phosphoribosyltransferase [Candidatus Diapherotrites archaeon]|nr:nicotinate phosphoribosyltransferase [Candidatus Diapherotrites archaeon]